jgi:hypothetical protein
LRKNHSQRTATLVWHTSEGGKSSGLLKHPPFTLRSLLRANGVELEMIEHFPFMLRPIEAFRTFFSNLLVFVLAAELPFQTVDDAFNTGL